MQLKTTQCIDKGNYYDIDVRLHNKHIQLLDECQTKFNQPYLYHFIAGIDLDSFNRSRFAENFKRTFKKVSKLEMKGKWNTVPDYIAMYGLEYSLGDERKISGNYATPTNSFFRKDYHHIHLYLCFDMCSPYRVFEINSLVIKTLNNIKGIYRPHYPKRKDTEYYYHNLKTECEDAVARIQYISKIEQKSGVQYKKKNSYFRSIKPKYC